MLKARFIFLATLAVALFAGLASAQSISTTAASVNNQLFVNLPTVVALRLNGDGTSSDVTFNVDAATYYGNAVNGTTINPANSGFTSLDAFSNDANGAELTVGLQTPPAAGSDAASVFDAVQLDGGAVTSFSRTLGVGMHLAVISRNDFSLHLTGSEPTGNYTYTLVYTLTAQ